MPGSRPWRAYGKRRQTHREGAGPCLVWARPGAHSPAHAPVPLRRRRRHRHHHDGRPEREEDRRVLAARRQHPAAGLLPVEGGREPAPRGQARRLPRARHDGQARRRRRQHAHPVPRRLPQPRARAQAEARGRPGGRRQALRRPGHRGRRPHVRREGARPGRPPRRRACLPHPLPPLPDPPGPGTLPLPGRHRRQGRVRAPRHRPLGPGHLLHPPGPDPARRRPHPRRGRRLPPAGGLRRPRRGPRRGRPRAGALHRPRTTRTTRRRASWRARSCSPPATPRAEPPSRGARRTTSPPW